MTEDEAKEAARVVAEKAIREELDALKENRDKKEGGGLGAYDDALGQAETAKALG